MGTQNVCLKKWPPFVLDMGQKNYIFQDNIGVWVLKKFVLKEWLPFWLEIY